MLKLQREEKQGTIPSLNFGARTCNVELSLINHYTPKQNREGHCKLADNSIYKSDDELRIVVLISFNNGGDQCFILQGRCSISTLAEGRNLLKTTLINAIIPFCILQKK